MRSVIILITAAAAVALAAPPVLADTPAPAAPSAGPIRHLAYSFTWGTQSDLESQESGVSSDGGASGGSGMTDYHGGNGDKGSIVVDVLGVQPDSGLILKVSENGERTRKSPPATCVVYGSTAVICDPNVEVNPEELTLLRFLGRGFVDPAKIDSKQHWQIQQGEASAYSLLDDFTIANNANGVMTIQETRTVKQTQPQPLTTDITAKIGYDFNRTLPTSIDEYAMQRSHGGIGQYQTIKTQTVLILQSDSLASTKG